MKACRGATGVMKYPVFFLVLFVFAFSPIAAQESPSFSLGRFNAGMTSKQLPDGTQTDFMAGFFYTDTMKSTGEIKLRLIKGASTNKIWGIDDSLMTRDRNVFEVFLLPYNYYFFKLPVFTFRAGAGLYYDYNKSNEEGYFSDSALGGEGVYHAYKNDFTGHLFGPVIDAGISGNLGFFSGSLSLGTVPVSFLLWDQTWKLSPLMAPPEYTVKSKNWTGPYFYSSLDLEFSLSIISLNVGLLYEYSSLKYTAAGFDSQSGEWADVEVTAKNETLSFEVSLLLNLTDPRTGKEKNKTRPQIGYGRRFNEADGGENYLLLGVKIYTF